VDSDLVLGRIANRVHNVVFMPGYDHSERINLVETGIVCVGGTIQGLEVKISFDDPSQIIIDSSAALVHGGGSTSGS